MRFLAVVGISLCVACRGATADGFDTVRAALDIGDYDTAYAALAQMGDEGDTLASILLANLALSEAAAPPNLGLGLSWLEHAADAGNVHAMLQIGALYQRIGPGLFPDRRDNPMAAGFPEAVHWFGRAADAESAVALSKLGGLLQLGFYSMLQDTITRDEEVQLAHDVLTRATEAGRPDAMRILATMSLRDDEGHAADLMQRAANLADPVAVGILASDPERFGVTDPVEILAWKMAARIAWALDEDPMSYVVRMADADDVSGLMAAVDAAIAESSEDVRDAAQSRAEEITAEWVSYLPGRFDGSASESSGSLFGGD